MGDEIKTTIGRPTKYSEELVTKFCNRIIAGESMSAICRDDDMPHKETIIIWRKQYKFFSDLYTEAVRLRANSHAEELEEITDEPLFYFDEKGNKRIDTGWVQLQRLKADSRKWIACKMIPRIYGNQTNEDNAQRYIVIPAPYLNPKNEPNSN